MKYIYYNRIKKILANPENNLLRLEAIEVTISMYIKMFGGTKLAEGLIVEYNKLETKLKK